MHILSKAAAQQEAAGLSMNFSDRALDLIADEVDWDAGSLMLWLTATGKLEDLKHEDELAESAEEPDDETEDEQDADD
jgi:hypothetical protein